MKIDVLTKYQLNRERCTGCGACLNQCRHDAITMETNEEGFSYPLIDSGLCKECGQCLAICPVAEYQNKSNASPEVYIAAARDEFRRGSSSGGIFPVVAKQIFDQGGVVYGAAFDDDQHLRFISAENWEELTALQGSKYVQAQTQLCFREIKKRIADGQKILFTGCPCQVAGCKKYVGENENLVTIDIFCHGVPSPKLFRDYVEEIGKGEKAKKVTFRDKKHGWNYYNFNVDMQFENGSSYVKGDSADDYLVAFLRAMSTRRSCDTCAFNRLPRPGDLSIGDCWGIERLDNSLNDTGGLSWVTINTPTGQKIFSEIGADLIICEKSKLETLKAYNKCGYTAKEISPERERLFDLYTRHGAKRTLQLAVHGKHDVGLLGVYSGANYGNSVSHYALYALLKQMGYEPLMIERIGRDYTKVCPQVTEFVQGHYAKYDLAPVLKDWFELRKLNENCHTFMVASDQIWKEGLYIPHLYALDFVDDNRKKLTYATSFGHDHWIGKHTNLEEMKFFLKRMDRISVREDSAVKICEDLFGVPAVRVIDPVLLAGQAFFDTLAAESHREETNYVFSYMLEPNRNKTGVIKGVANALGLTTINATGMIVTRERETGTDLHLEKDLAVVDWINLIKNSRIVVTDSFHGMCLSILFRKDFIVLEHETRGNDRFYSLLKLLRLEHRVLKCPTDVEKAVALSTEPIAYDVVYATLDPEIRRSKEWLASALALEKDAQLTEFDILRKKTDELLLEERERAQLGLRRKFNTVKNFYKTKGLKATVELVLLKLRGAFS